MGPRQDPFTLLWSFAPLSPVIAIVFAVYAYARHRRRCRGPERVGITVYILVLIVFGVLAYLIGLGYGIERACSVPSAANLCGLEGVFVSGPLASALAILLVGGTILLLPSQEPPTDQTAIRNVSPIYMKLWRGEYPLGVCFWGFFAAGVLMARAVGVLGGFAFIFFPRVGAMVRLSILAFQIATAVGVWRSANAFLADKGGQATLADSIKSIVARIAVLLLTAWSVGVVLSSIYLRR